MHLPSLFTLFTLAACAAGSALPKDRVDARAVGAKAKTTAVPSHSSSSTSISSKKTSSTKVSSTSSSKSSIKSSSSSSVSSKSSSKNVSSSSVKSSPASSSSSKSSTSSSSSSSTSLVADASCSNTALTRACWGNGYSIATDFDTKWPTTGKTVTYSLDITNTTLSPDGTERMVLAVNGKYPGPTIYADWGDMLEITVTNSMKDNSTGIHWHGLRQYHSNGMDGVPGITECPLAPGESKTYTFQATQFGTSWYHSHFSGQYGDGVLGPIVIHGPATANYDIDLGPLTVTDWYHSPVMGLAALTQATFGGPPEASNGLINGTMVSLDGTSGSYYTTTITHGKKFRLRLINTSVDNHFMVSLDNHTFTVITSDFVPIKPYTADWIFIGIGQRYDVIITANQTIDNYWFRAEVQDDAGCGSNLNNGNIKSIFTYTGATSGNPTSSATEYTQRCTDETQLVPYWDSYISSSALISTTALDIAIGVGLDTDGDTIVQWGVNFSALSVAWDAPILEFVSNGSTDWPSSENLITLPTESQYYYWVIQESAGVSITIDVPHPIHLHGHDFYVLGTGVGNYTTDLVSTLNFDNPTRRDVAMLPAGGWLVLAFEADNPGAWIMHCHIAWHAGEGLAVQFLESKSTILSTSSLPSDFATTCASWDAWYPAKAPYIKDDSGI